MKKQVVIEIDEEIIKAAKENLNYYPTYQFETIWKSICNGTVLSEPHGRLIDADKLLKYKTDHEYISTHIIYNAPTVNAISTQTVRDAIAEIEQIEINGQIDANTLFIRTADQVKQMVIKIIQKHTGVQE